MLVAPEQMKAEAQGLASGEVVLTGRAQRASELLEQIEHHVRMRMIAGYNHVSFRVPQVSVEVVSTVWGMLKWLGYSVKERRYNQIGDRPDRRKVDWELEVLWV